MNSSGPLVDAGTVLYVTCPPLLEVLSVTCLPRLGPAAGNPVVGTSGPLALCRTVYGRFAIDMLVYDFIHVSLPVAEVRHRLLNAVTGLWQQVAVAAYEEGEDLLSRVGPFGPVPGLSKAVSVHVGKVRDRGDGFVMPLRWSATGSTELFPVMQADLEVAPLGEQQSQLRFSGSYDPPLGSLGRGLDRLLLHQLAEATVRALLKQLVEALQAEPAAKHPVFTGSQSTLDSADPR